MTELVRDYWELFLFDTLLWTGGLIALALLLRRPVAKHLGAGAAYALWFLPLARLLFPPVTLPAWMRPASSESEALMEPVRSGLVSAPGADVGFSYTEFVAPAMPMPASSSIDFVVPLVIVWLVGAAIFMGRRFWLYGELRRELLMDARPVGEVGNIRLIETPAISGPMAFGVLDKVVALPDGFMVSRERQVRDLAIAHEVAHHRGHDILANMLIQPLFAMHWFNPLGWMGWTAMRRDQEAFCDARVVASRSRDERAAYASVIADYARRSGPAPRPALAAPMACPVLGDKSIIHRLRSLPMTDHSRRRRLVARGTVAAALVALPMTASVYYSEAIAAPSTKSQIPASPLSPAAPSAPLSPQEVAAVEPGDRTVRIERVDDNGNVTERRTVRYGDSEWSEMTAGDEADHQAAMAEHEARMAELEADRAERNSELQERLSEQRELRIEAAELARERAAEARANSEMRVAMASATAAGVQARAVAARARASAPRVVNQCRGYDAPVTSVTDAQGRTTMYVCEEYGDRIALKALKAARQALALERNLSDRQRAEALRELDAEISELSR